jgi:hypothetical protein
MTASGASGSDGTVLAFLVEVAGVLSKRLEEGLVAVS